MQARTLRKYPSQGWRVMPVVAMWTLGSGRSEVVGLCRKVGITVIEVSSPAHYRGAAAWQYTIWLTRARGCLRDRGRIGPRDEPLLDLIRVVSHGERDESRIIPSGAVEVWLRTHRSAILTIRTARELRGKRPRTSVGAEQRVLQQLDHCHGSSVILNLLLEHCNSVF